MSMEEKLVKSILSKYKEKKMMKVKPETFGGAEVATSKGKKEIWYPSVHLDNQNVEMIKNKKVGDTVLLEGKITSMSENKRQKSGEKEKIETSASIDIIGISS